MTSRLLKIVFVFISFLSASTLASSQPIQPLITLFLGQALRGAFANEAIPLYSVFDSKPTTQDIKRLKNQWKILSREIGNTPTNTDLFLSRGHVLDTLGLSEKALADFKMAFDLGDHRRQVFMALGIENYRMGARTTSLSYFKKIIDHDSLDADAYLHSGIAMLYDSRKFQTLSVKTAEAIPYFEKSLKVKPEYKEALILLGYCYTVQKRKPEAIELFKKAIRVSPKSFSPYILLYRIYLKDKDSSNACLILRDAKVQGINIPEKYYKKACR